MAGGASLRSPRHASRSPSPRRHRHRRRSLLRFEAQQDRAPLHLEQRRSAAGPRSSSSGHTAARRRGAHTPLHPTTNRRGPTNSDPALAARGPAAPARQLASPQLPRCGRTTSRPHGRLASTSSASTRRPPFSSTSARRRPGTALRSLRPGTQPRFGVPPSTSGRPGRGAPSSISRWPWRGAFSSYHGTFRARRIDRRRGGACRRGGAPAPLTGPTARWIDTTLVALPLRSAMRHDTRSPSPRSVTQRTHARLSGPARRWTRAASAARAASCIFTSARLSASYQRPSPPRATARRGG
jgi:hypothetical protein